MDFSLSPVITNLFMAEFEEVVLENSNKKRKLWMRYVNDILDTWKHGDADLNQFMNYSNIGYK